MTALPTGTVTFLFTDIEGSTALLQRLGDRYADVLADCRRLLRTAVEAKGGHEVDTEGDALLAAFPSAREALRAAVTAQHSILCHPWPDGAPLRIRMGLHTGEARVTDAGYVGMDIHRAARICAAGHGGQILLSDTICALVANDLPNGVNLRDLGEHRLKDLAHPHRLFQVVDADLPADFPPLRSLDAHPQNLPIQLTSFIGREREIAEIKTLLSKARLVTLTGSGGAGKTRLALQVATDVLENYSDGVWLSEFAPIADPALVPKAVASALSVPEQPGRDMTETLFDALRAKTVLLVLDNCEHLLTACRDLAVALLRKCPQVRFLATSREGLGVPGETLWRVPSLSVPDLRHLPPSEELVLYDAVRLFVDRAVANIPGFAVTNENAAAVARVCQRLDGIPLAIELAAARVKVLAVEQIANRLDDRFRLLTGGSPVALPRHQTLHGAIDWSYNLLSESERVVLRRLSVFAGGWTLEAAESVCGSGSVEAAKVLDLLTSLVDKSLVLAETHRGEARYRLLETVRQYGLGMLVESEEADDIRRRHRDWYLSLAEQASPELLGLGMGPGSHVWLDRLETEHDNLRGALEWSKMERSGAEAELRLAGSLWRLWFERGYWSEGRRWLERSLTRSGDAQAPALLNALRGAAWLAWHQYDDERAAALGEKGLALSRGLGNTEGLAWSLHILGLLAARRHAEYTRAAALFQESLALGRELGNKWWVSTELIQLGNVARNQGDDDRAAALYSESLTLAREVGENRQIAYSLQTCAILALDQGEHGRAGQLYIESLALLREIGDRGFVTLGCLEGLASLACHQGHFERAARSFGVADALRQALHRPRLPSNQAEHEQRVASTRSALGDTAFELAWAEGRAMTLEQAIEYALQSEG